MELIINAVLGAGRSAVELVFFTILPVMVIMLTLMRLLEARGVLDWVTLRVTPVLRPLGLTGLSSFAALQINFVSFSAPISTLAIMEQRGSSDRHLAATLAMVLAMSQANVSLPMTAMGLELGFLILFSIVGGLAASAITYHGFGRHLCGEEHVGSEALQHAVADSAKGVLDVINRAGAEAFRIAVNSIPMLVLSLSAIMVLRALGAIDLLTEVLAPLLDLLHINPQMILPTLTKYLAGGTAMMGVMGELLRDNQISSTELNRSIGFLLNPLDVPGLAILLSAGPRLAAVWKPAVLGALIGIALRTTAHALLF